MNGVAKDFWTEVFDLRASADDGDGDRRQARSAKKKARKTLVRRTVRRVA